MSVRTTSGCSASIALRSDGRSSHVATSSMSASGSSRRRIPSRTRYVSSATTTRIIALRLYDAALDGKPGLSQRASESVSALMRARAWSIAVNAPSWFARGRFRLRRRRSDLNPRGTKPDAVSSARPSGPGQKGDRMAGFLSGVAQVRRLQRSASLHTR